MCITFPYAHRLRQRFRALSNWLVACVRAQTSFAIVRVAAGTRRLWPNRIKHNCFDGCTLMSNKLSMQALQPNLACVRHRCAAISSFILGDFSISRADSKSRYFSCLYRLFIPAKRAYILHIMPRKGRAIWSSDYSPLRLFAEA